MAFVGLQRFLHYRQREEIRTTLLNELRRGCAGSMTGVSLVDIYANIYNSYIRGEHEKAQEMFDKVMSFAGADHRNHHTLLPTRPRRRWDRE